MRMLRSGPGVAFIPPPPADPPTITTSSLTAYAGASIPYSATVAATDGTVPYSWDVSVGALPAGLTLNAVTGVISGTPTNLAGETANFTVRVTDDDGLTDTQALTITTFADEGSDIRDWIALTGYRRLPSRTYTAGELDPGIHAHATHAVDGTHPYGGWCVLEADVKGAALFDLAATGLLFGVGPSLSFPHTQWRVMLIGCASEAGLIQVWNSDYVRLWYHDGESTIADWITQYTAEGGNPAGAHNDAARDAMVNFDPSFIRVIGEITAVPYCNGIDILGCDIGPCGDDGIYLQGVFGSFVNGNIITDTNHHAQVSADIQSAWFHADAFQVEWGGDNDFEKNFFGGHVQLEAHDSSITDTTMLDCDFAGSQEVALTTDKQTHDFVNVHISGRSWGRAQYLNGSTYTNLPHYNAGFDVVHLEVNGTPTSLTVSVADTVPAYVTITANLITDLPTQASAVANPDIYAKQWRTSHPYSSWAAFYASLGAGSDWP